MFEFEATDRKARDAFFARHPELEVRHPPAHFSRAARVAPQAWGEHCVECAIPHCYSTCDLYDERPDGKCRRFSFGIHPNREVRSWLPYGVEIDFRLISHLWTKGSALTLPAWQYRALDGANRVLGRAVDGFSRLLGPLSSRRRPNRGFYHARKQLVRWMARRGSGGEDGGGGTPADGFLLQVINPHDRTLNMRFEASADPRPRNAPIFQTSFALPPGFSEHWVPVSTIRRQVDVFRPFEMSLLLGNSDPTLLYILSASFVSGVSGPITQRMGDGDGMASRVSDPQRIGSEGTASVGGRDEAAHHGGSNGSRTNGGRRRALPTVAAQPGAAAEEGVTPASSPTVKAVVWDLDHTVWDGVLVESEGEPPALLPGIAEMVRALDDRGILQSVVSKNHHDQAWARLEETGLAEYFLYPEISWGPKSAGVRRIIENLNIGSDTVVLIDDQPFERAEVEQSLPGVEVLPETVVATLLERDRFQVRPSAEGKRRREKYRDQARRDAALQEHGSDYIAFLRSARLTLDIHPPTADKLDRVHELIQRTNQMNFSGNRYTREEVEARIARPDLEAFVLRVQDRFGDYGLVGFAFVHLDEARARLVDLAMSCRVQSKHVEHQFLLALMNRYRARGLSRFEVEFRRTERNGPVSQVFADLEFALVAGGAAGAGDARGMRGTTAGASGDARGKRGTAADGGSAGGSDAPELWSFDLGRPSALRDYIEVVQDVPEGVAG